MIEVDQPEGPPVKLRVALLTNALSPHTLPLCNEISRRVEHFRAFLSEDTDSFHKFPKVRGSFPVTIQRSFNNLRFLRREHGFWSPNRLQIPYDTFQQLRAYQPDVILSNQLGMRTLLCALYRRKTPGTRLFLWATLSSHTEQNRAWYRRLLRRWIIARVDAAFVNGRGGEEYLRSLGFAGPVFTVPYTIDDALFRRDGNAPARDGLRLFYCGRLDPCKGVGVFCERLNRWCVDHPATRVQFEIVGAGIDADLIRSLKTPSNLTLSLLPRRKQDELAQHYHAADLFVLPTLGDEWAVVINEAMSAGLPVLGSVYSQAVTELVVDGACGWNFDPKSEQGTFESLNRALTTSRTDLRQMSINARERIASISPARVAARAVHAMTEVVRDKVHAAEHYGSAAVSLRHKTLGETV